MFNKLIGDLPLNPSLIDNLPLIEKKIANKLTFQLLSLLVLSALFFLTTFSIINSPENSVLSSPNDLVTGGFASQIDAVLDCRNNLQDFRSILNGFGISCNDLQSAQPTQISTTQSNLYSINRVPYGVENEDEVISNRQVLWLRPFGSLWLKPETIQALTGKGVNGAFYVLYNSGNLVFPYIPRQNLNVCTRCPIESVAIVNSTSGVSGTSINSNGGDDLDIELAATNTTRNTIYNYIFEVNVASLKTYAYITNTYGGKIQGNQLSWVVTIKPGQTITKVLTSKINNPIINTPISATDPGYFNQNIYIRFGNTATIKLKKTISKQLEIYSQSAPGVSGPISILIMGILWILNLMLCLRNYVLLQELKLVKIGYLRS